MSKAITTKYLPATNYKPSRIKAFAEGGAAVVLSYDDEFSADRNHAGAARALATKMRWRGHYVQGGTLKGQSVFVNTECAWAETFTIEDDGAPSRKLGA